METNSPRNGRDIYKLDDEQVRTEASLFLSSSRKVTRTLIYLGNSKLELIVR